MKLYNRLSKLPLLKKYSFKFLFIAFIGIHVPLLGVIGYIIFKPQTSYGPFTIVILVLLLTILATVVTILVTNRLVTPINLANNALNDYITTNKPPQLPVVYTDEIGVLMKNLQHSIVTLDKLIKDNKDLMGMLSHDLRSPAASVIGLTTLLKEDMAPDEIAHVHEQIEVLMRDQIELMETMLFVLRSEDKSLHAADKQQVFLSQLIEGAIKKCASAAGNKHITVIPDVSPQLYVYAEIFSLTQALINLLQNAIKFSYTGGEITIKATLYNNQVAISVQDRGIGFDLPDTSLLFERFTTLGRNGTEGEPTHGLGLYLCKKIVKNHNGHITAFSEGTDKGATFTIYLPQYDTSGQQSPLHKLKDNGK